MLTYLAVKNIAVIEKVSLEFEKGLNVITGETGAGKSVLVGALKYLTGDRLGRVTPRNPQEKFSAEGIFCDDLNIELELIEQYDIEDELIISRETDENGKNKAFINGKAAPVNKLRDISESLIDIHGQHENQFLFNPAKHLSFVDFFVDNSLKDDFSIKYRAYREKLDKLEDLKKNRENIIKMQEMYKMQYNEILSYNIDLEKDAVIEDRIKFLSSIEKVREAVTSSMDALSDGEITTRLSHFVSLGTRIKLLSPASSFLTIFRFNLGMLSIFQLSSLTKPSVIVGQTPVGDYSLLIHNFFAIFPREQNYYPLIFAGLTNFHNLRFKRILECPKHLLR